MRLRGGGLGHARMRRMRGTMNRAIGMPDRSMAHRDARNFRRRGSVARCYRRVRRHRAATACSARVCCRAHLRIVRNRSRG